jgi:RNA 2',3'-cyclic 3'-phosphodiesterase
VRSAKYKLYFALHPPPEAAAAALRVLANVQPAEGFTARPMPAERLHVSLNWVGGFHRPPTGIVGKARDVAAGVAARPFEASLNRIGTWRAGDPPWPLVLWGDEGLIGVDALHRAIHRAMVAPGMAPRRDPPFEPHLTLLRDRAVMPEAFIDPIRWTVNEFVLVLTVQGEARQEVLGRFPLSG